MAPPCPGTRLALALLLMAGACSSPKEVAPTDEATAPPDDEPAPNPNEPVDEGSAACLSFFTALCEADPAVSCGIGGGAPGQSVEECVAEATSALPDAPSLSQADADACVALVRAPECDDRGWQRSMEECLYAGVFACMDLSDSGGFGPDSGWGPDSGSGFDSGWSSGETEDGGGPGGGAGPNACDWPDVGICFAFDGYRDAEAWCTDVAASYGFTSTFYAGEGCPRGGEGPCEVPAGGDFPVAVEAYSYEVEDAQRACEDAGGTWRG